MARFGWIGSWIGGWVGSWLGSRSPPSSDPGGLDWTAIIEGIPIVFSSGDPNAALTAHGSPFTRAIGFCLLVDGTFSQTIDVEDPFASEGEVKLHFLPGVDETGANTDEIGIMMHRGKDGAETVLDVALTRVATGTVDVKADDNFDGVGHINIGTECIETASKAADVFTVATNGRGKYVPFGRDNATRRFARHHRVGNFDYQVPMETIVAEFPKDWAGREVALFRHQRVGGVLETRAEVEAAGRVFAFRIAGEPAADDPATGATTVPLENEIDAIANTTLFRDPWKGKLAEGVFLAEGFEIGFRDNDGATTETADPLTVIAAAGTPADASEIVEGTYTAAELASALNAHLAEQLDASNLHGSYAWSVVDTDDGPRIRVEWSIDGVAFDPVWWELYVEGPVALPVAKLLGVQDQIDWSSAVARLRQNGSADQEHVFGASRPPARVYPGFQGLGGLLRIGVESAKGTFRNQQASLPAWAGNMPQLYPGEQWGLFLVDGVTIVAAADFDGNGEIQALTHINASINNQTALPGTEALSALEQLTRYEGDGAGPLEVRQVIAIEGPAHQVLTRLFYSTGTAGYNHADHDVYPLGVGIGIPHEKLGDDFVDSCTSLPAAMSPITLIIEKPITVGELIDSDLLARRAHLIWYSPGLRIVSWSTPTTDQAVHLLTEENKAAPVEEEGEEFAASLISNKWAMPMIEFKFNRSLKTGEYQSTFILEAPSAIDDGGGKGAEKWTIECRNVYTDDAGFLSLLADFLPFQAMFCKPLRFVRRTISPDLYFDIRPADQALLTDENARHPRTGVRGMTAEPCLVVSVSFNDLIELPGEDEAEAPRGTVELAFIPTDRVATYSPCAEFDGGDYNDATNEITCQSHAHSAATDFVDAKHFDEAQIRVVEVDPPDPADPLTWTRLVTSVSGDVITHDGDPLGDGVGEDPFDDTKTYRVIFQSYADQTATQRAKASQADNADGMIQDLAQPNVYGNPSFFGTYTEDTSLTEFERHADLAAADGAPRDTGYERGHMRNVQTLIDRKCAVQIPALDLVETDPSALITGGQMYATHQAEVFVGVRRLYSTIDRFLYAAPSLRPTTAGAKNWRISLCSKPLNGDSLIDVDLQGVIAQVSGVTDGTTNVQIPDIDEGAAGEGLSLGVVPHDLGDWSGIAWLVLEVGDNLATRGIAHCYVGPREES